MSDENAQAQGDKGRSDPKMVPESDLLAIKGSLESKLKQQEDDYKAQLTTAVVQADSVKTELIKERTAKEQLETSLKEANNFKAQFEALSKDHETLKASIPVYETTATQSKRDLVAFKYGVDPKVLENKSLGDLKSLEEAMEIAGKGRPSNFYDRGTGGQAPTVKQPFSLEMSEMEEIRKNAK